jgi:hypothetical protein
MNGRDRHPDHTAKRRRFQPEQRFRHSRAILNPKGVPGTSSGVTARRGTPKQQFIQAQIGADANSGRNIIRTPGISIC